MAVDVSDACGRGVLQPCEGIGQVVGLGQVVQEPLDRGEFGAAQWLRRMCRGLAAAT